MYCIKLLLLVNFVQKNILQHLNLTPFSAVGWSEGGRVSLHIAHQGKDLVKKIVGFIFSLYNCANFDGKLSISGSLCDRYIR